MATNKFFFTAYDADVDFFSKWLESLQVPFVKEDKGEGEAFFTIKAESGEQTKNAKIVVDFISEAEIQQTEEAIAEFNRQHPNRRI